MSASSKKKLRKEENAAQLTEKQQKEQKQAKKLKLQTVAFVVALSLIVVIAIGSLGITAYKNSGIAERNTTALTVGSQSLSNADLSYFYIDNLTSNYNQWYETYGENASLYLSLMYGLDLTKPLDEQPYVEDPDKTYADYFIDEAIEKAVSTYALYEIAAAEGFKLDDETVKSIDSTIASLDAVAVQAGYRGIDAYLKTYYGNGATGEGFRNYLIATETATAYEADAYNKFTYTEGDLEAYDEEHYDELFSYSYDSFYLPVSSFIQCTAEEGEENHEHTQEELDAAQKLAKEAADALVLAKPKTAKDFTAAIQEIDSLKSSSCTENKDVLYSEVANADIAAWMIESGRKAGDMTIVTNDTETTDEDGNATTKIYGYTVVVYRGRNDNTTKLVNVRHILKAFEGGTTDEYGTVTYPEGAFEEAQDAIAALQKDWLDAGGTVDAFAKLAEEESDDPGSVETGGLYENVYPGQMVPAFNDWCFDESRKPGDYGIVETDYGFHLLYYVGQSDTNYRDFMIENALRDADYQKWYEDAVGSAKHTVGNTSKMNTGIILASN